MRLVGSISAVALAATLAVGCSDTVAPNEVTLDDLAGNWSATSLEFTNVANTSQVFDLVANGGTFTLTLQSAGTFSGAQSLAGQTETLTGTVSVSNGTLTLTETGETLSFTITAYDGDTITIASTTNVSWDFGFDGQDEEASITATLQRQ